MQKRRLSGRRPLLLAVGAGVTVAALAAGMTSAFAATVFSDDFNDGNTTGWSKSGGTWSVVRRLAACSSSPTPAARSPAQFAGQTSWTNYTVQARVKPPSFGSSSALVGLAARATSSTKFYRLALLAPDRAELQAVNGSSVTVDRLRRRWTSAPAPGTRCASRSAAAPSAASSTARQIALRQQQPVGAGRIGLQTAYASGGFDDVTGRLVRRRHPDHAAADHHSATHHAASRPTTPAARRLADAHRQPEGRTPRSRSPAPSTAG